MIPYPNIDPVIFRLGPLAFRWYGLMYLVGFVAGFFIIRNRYLKTVPRTDPKRVESLVLWACLGLIVGARLGEVIFYHWVDYSFYLENPLEIIAVWHGGMSFHGGLIGAVLAGAAYLLWRGMPILPATDAAFLAVPIGLGAGRLANFINGELYGRVTELPWGMVFPGAGPLPRHPSQLYEFLLEGPLLFVILWLVRDRLGTGRLTALFLILYGLFRFLVEFVREPDPQLGFVLSWLTMGQILCLVQVAAGVLLWLWVAGAGRGVPTAGQEP